MGIAWTDISKNSNGGTELLGRELERRMPQELMDNFQIFLSRIRDDLDGSKIRILWEHDLAGDPECEHLRHGGWKKFHRIVAVSAWQKEMFIRAYGNPQNPFAPGPYDLPPSKIVTIQNAINPIDASGRKPYVPGEPLRLIYTSTPHRGLQILYPVFERLSQEYPELELDVFSSFGIYGWGQKDEMFKDTFEQLKAHPKIRYHGAQPNDVVRQALVDAHILAYPNIWLETSCLCLIEAMSAGVTCVHPDFGALPETAGNWTTMYQWHENPNYHAQRIYDVLREVINSLKTNPEAHYNRNLSQSAYTNHFYSWEGREKTWLSFLSSLVASNEPRELPEEEVFSYDSDQNGPLF